MHKIKDMFFRGSNIRGEIGIEIEMEGKKFPLDSQGAWDSTGDGSLRGRVDEKREYVLTKPCKREDTLTVLSQLSSRLTSYGSTICPSYRTGVHIHTNIRNMTFTQAINYILSYYIFEDALMQYAGKDRIGNLFCLRVADAEGVLILLENAIKQKDLSLLHTDNIRYSSLNLKAIKTYGSLEFRGMPFNGDFHSIETWITLLLCVKDFSLTLKDPTELVALLSEKGGDNLAREVFGNMFQIFPKIDWDSTMLNSVRLIQRLAYIIDWEENHILIPTKLKPIVAKEQPEVRWEEPQAVFNVGDIERAVKKVKIHNARFEI